MRISAPRHIRCSRAGLSSWPGWSTSWPGSLCSRSASVRRHWDTAASPFPLGLTMAVVGVVLLLSGLGRMTARLEVTGSGVVWVWAFARHELAFEELVDASLVEKGSPASGGASAGLLGGGLLGAAAWWAFDAVLAFVTSEPTVGSFDLVLVKRYGGPVEVRSISAWSTRASHSQANAALEALKTAITERSRSTPHRFSTLRDDAWELPGHH